MIDLQVVHPSSDWPSWLSEQCSQCGWKHSSGSPLVWRELIDRGGKGLYLGGLQEFEHYASQYHGISPSTTQELEEAIARENQETLLSLKLERESAPNIEPLRVCVTNASSQIAYHLVQQIATGRVYGEEKVVAIHLYDSDVEKREELEGVALELMDLASPVLYEIRVAESVKDAVDSVSVAFILDYPYQPVLREESNTCTQQLEDPGTGQEERQVEGEGEKEDTSNISKEELVSSQKETGDDSSELEGPSHIEEGGKTQEGEKAEAKKPSSAGVEKQGSRSTLPVIEEEHTIATDTTTDKDGDTVKDAESASLSQAEQVADPPSTELATPPELVEVAQLYHCYGATMDFCSRKDVQVVVCGRYANTGAALMANAVTSIDKTNFIAAPCLAEQQAKAIIASKVELNGADIAQVAVWGHTCGEKVATDLSHVRVKHFPGAVMGPDPYDLPLTRCIFQTEWLESKFHQMFEARHKRMEGYRRNGCGSGAALVEAMGLIKLAKQWREGEDTDGGGSGWSSVGMVSTEEGEGVYGIPAGVVFSQPAQCSEGVWKPVLELAVSDKIKVRNLPIFKAGNSHHKVIILHIADI